MLARHQQRRRAHQYPEGRHVIEHENSDPQIGKVEAAVERAAVLMEMPVFSGRAVKQFLERSPTGGDYEKFVAFDPVNVSDVAAPV